MQPAIQLTRIQIQRTDEMLVEHARAGNLEAFEEIFYRYCQPLYEYVFLLTGNKSITEKVLLKSFIRFYQRLPMYQFEHRVRSELFRIATDRVEKSARKGELGNFSVESDADFSSKWQRLSLEDRMVLILGKKHGLNVGTISWILKRKLSKVIDCFGFVESLGWKEIQWPVIDPPRNDYRAVLGSRIKRFQHEKKSYLLYAGVASVLILSIILYGKFSSRHPASPNPQSSSNLKIEQLASKSTPNIEGFKNEIRSIPLQKFQIDHQAFFTQDQSFAEESLLILPGRGKVLAIDYDLFAISSSAGLTFNLKELDLAQYTSFDFWIRGDSSMGYPKILSVQFKKDTQLVSEESTPSISSQWRQIKLPLQFKVPTRVNRIIFLFDDRTVGAQKHGRFYLDQLAFEQKLKK